MRIPTSAWLTAGLHRGEPLSIPSDVDFACHADGWTLARSARQGCRPWSRGSSAYYVVIGYFATYFDAMPDLPNPVI